MKCKVVPFLRSWPLVSTQIGVGRLGLTPTGNTIRDQLRHGLRLLQHGYIAVQSTKYCIPEAYEVLLYPFFSPRHYGGLLLT